MVKVSELERPKVGIGLLIVKGRTHVLLGQRVGAHGSGEYGGVGGHMENGESFKDTALRELREEIGEEIQITTPRVLCVSNIRKYSPKHYLDIGMIAEWVKGKAKIMEPEKIISWKWYKITDLPSPLFEPVEYYVRAYKTGKKFFEL